jgi:hypothetical protein
MEEFHSILDDTSERLLQTAGRILIDAQRSLLVPYKIVSNSKVNK